MAASAATLCAVLETCETRIGSLTGVSWRRAIDPSPSWATWLLPHAQRPPARSTAHGRDRHRARTHCGPGDLDRDQSRRRRHLTGVIEAGANCLPTALLFLGTGALAYATFPRASSSITYGVVIVAFLWNLVAALARGTRLAGPVLPVRARRPGTRRALQGRRRLADAGDRALCVVRSLQIFRRRDLIGP